MVSEMFIVNDTAKNDIAVQLAMKSYAKRLQDEENYQAQVRAGIVTPQPITVWNISDYD